MAPMKRRALPLVALLSPWSAQALLRGGQDDAVLSRVEAGSRELSECAAVAKEFIPSPAEADKVTDAAVDYCVSKTTNKEKYICANFRNAVEISLVDVPPGTKLSAESFCELSEARMHEAIGATLVPNIALHGLGDFLHYKVNAKACSTLAVKAMVGHAPKGTIPRKEAGHVWFAMCLHQDCAHALPSRTKDCSVDRAPTHNAWVCEAAMRHMEASAKRRELEPIKASEICDMYGGFVADLGVSVEAYVFVLHKGDGSHLPAPEQAAQALMSSQLIHDAAGRALRAGAGQQVKPNKV